MTFEWCRVDVYADGMGGTEVSPKSGGRYVFAEHAIQREAELLARIRELEAQAAKAAELISKAVGIMKPEAG